MRYTAHSRHEDVLHTASMDLLGTVFEKELGASGSPKIRSFSSSKYQVVVATKGSGVCDSSRIKYITCFDNSRTKCSWCPEDQVFLL